MDPILDRYTLASRADRLMGQILDALIGAAPLLASVVLSSFSDALGAIAAMGAILWSVFYYLFADGFSGGQSMGKRWIGTRVVDANSGEECTFFQSFVRNLLLAILGPVDWIFILGQRHQRLGDKVAGTVVIVDRQLVQSRQSAF